MNSHLLNNDYLRKIIYDKKCTNNIIRLPRLLIFSLMQKEHEMQYSFLISRKDIYLPIIWCFMTFQIHWLTKFCILYSIPKLISRLLLFRGSKKVFTNWLSSRLSPLCRRLLWKVLFIIYSGGEPQQKRHHIIHLGKSSYFMF